MTEVLYTNPLTTPEDVAGFRMEGDGAASFPRGRMRLESLRRPEDGQAANIVFWCPETVGPGVEISWNFWPVHEPGLCILFFAARGRGGEDLFDDRLAVRTGPYDQYHSGDIDAYHVSYFRRMWAPERAFHTANLRKSHGFHLVAQGADPLPDVLDAKGPYRMALRHADDEITFAIDDVVSFRWRDDGTLGGPPHGAGKIGFRQMAPMIAEYADLTVARA
ncbi:YesU family protein [Georgenia halophila]|uniref:YesU family protein n=1 Tax=Georgenia halophila TaxID=620889 RepID=A0ABP8LF68_9MICO